MTDSTHSDPPGPKPFTFERIFSRVDDAAPKQASPQENDAPPTDAAFEEGRKWGQEEMRASIEARLAEFLEKLPGQIEEMITRHLAEIPAPGKPKKSASSKRKKIQ